MNLHETIRNYIAALNAPGLCLVYVPEGLNLGNNIGGQPHAAFPISEDSQVAIEGLRLMRQACVDAVEMRLLFIRNRPVGTIIDQEADLVLSLDFDMEGVSVTVHKSRGFVVNMPDTHFTYQE